jgi:hypothetical protein
MRSHLVLRSPNQGTGCSDSWAFSGRDESALRDYLGHLDAYLTPTPHELWDAKKHGRVIEADDRWLAAMLLFSGDVYDTMHRATPAVVQAESAWTAAGARHLADILPAELGDLQVGISERFGLIATRSQ